MADFEQKKPRHIKTAMRLPVALHAELREAAERAGHSINDEIINRLAAGTGGASLFDIVRQNEHTHKLIQQIIDAIGPRR